MRISPYPTGRFATYLTKQAKAFRDLIYRCQINSYYVDAGTAILRQGEQLEQIFVVPVGRVSMNIIAVNGRRFQLGEVNCDHHIFGEMEFFTETPCQWTVTADEHLQVDLICIHRLMQALQQQPEMMVFFASALAEDYQDSMAIYTSRLLHPIAYNIAFDLLQQKQHSVTLGGFDKVNQEAERFGTSSRVYRRAVKELIERGLITKQGNRLAIVNEPQLRRFLGSVDPSE
ncbi:MULTISPECIES: Crp/Fnr family transcriptional regulator [Vibrio]|uniref:Crp/Fnr family transcriptional regulator n=1 Tax=Vibrio TaxID=662 RepID=UPI000C1735B7|nr:MULTISPECIES: Crp/Fnr family transcriptional regulator [Vibrio]NAW68635.1 cyclic nucleotide-binding domain-containing protein [Vibrio sp. V28_P6S34P95]NAX04537.1 cyclic nucleotide-binding domain-containing protein [Vibrio sp. V30_P3S12P165]NAX33294.1 cyclic nucleotide-binding domain-containing protein [Vibrio sp. V29_P1S30P107]NAX36790.1 cyclic nucleotide-binding domain-containing protein [Vibrio sp. V27_P1S3P104]NAX41658.1 cyclic nucleotide-binding domain-containing protein [Vibrio sp. V26